MARYHCHIHPYNIVTTAFLHIHKFIYYKFKHPNLEDYKIAPPATSRWMIKIDVKSPGKGDKECEEYDEYQILLKQYYEFGAT